MTRFLAERPALSGAGGEWIPFPKDPVHLITEYLSLGW